MIIDWTRSMSQTYEFCVVDPGTWKDKKLITNVESCTIVRDLEVETLGSATITCDDDYTDEYVRSYLVVDQDKVRDRIALGTHIFQTPNVKHDGKHRSMDQEGYTPLLELKEKYVDMGFAVMKGQNVLSTAEALIKTRMRAPFVSQVSSDTLADNFIANLDDTWLTYVTDMLAMAKHGFSVDPMGMVSFAKHMSPEVLRPKWTYTDDNSSILQPSVTLKRDLYGIPNVVECIFSPQTGRHLYSRVVNDDKNSIVSTVRRGREVTYRDTSPNVTEGITQGQLDAYARNVLKEMSSLEFEVSYKHGYCPVTVGDGVRLNYTRAGISNRAAKVIRQSIKLDSGCQVDETAVYTDSLWG